MDWVVSSLHTTSKHGVSSITTADAHTSAASSRLNWRPRRFKWTRPFRRKTKSGFCACAIAFQTKSNTAHLFSSPLCLTPAQCVQQTQYLPSPSLSAQPALSSPFGSTCRNSQHILTEFPLCSVHYIPFHLSPKFPSHTTTSFHISFHRYSVACLSSSISNICDLLSSSISNICDLFRHLSIVPRLRFQIALCIDCFILHLPYFPIFTRIHTTLFTT